MTPVGNSRELRTKRDLIGCLVRRWPSRLLLAGLGLAIFGRVVAGRMGDASGGMGVTEATTDVLVVVIGIIVIGPVEWLVHHDLFHAPTSSRRSRTFGTGRRHLLHHDEPTDVTLLLLDRRGLVVLMVGTAALASAWAIPIGLMLGRSLVAIEMTAIVVAWLALAHYEWTHLLSHSGCRPRSGRYRRLARRHLHHHYRDEGQWLGVTSNLGDRLFATTAPE